MAREPTQGELFSGYLHQHEEKQTESEKHAREVRRRKDKRYKQKQGCIRLYLDVDTLESFKTRSREKGVSQSGVLRAAINDFIAGID